MSSADCAPVRDLDSSQKAIAGYLRQLSGGVVRRVLPTGPVFDRRRIKRRVLTSQSFTPLLTGSARRGLIALTVVWVLLMVCFWVWWSRPEHISSWFGFIMTTLLLLPISGMQAYFLIIVNRARRVAPHRLPELRVAMVVTKAPSEPWELVKVTLTAMLNQRLPYPYDVWLADEAPSPETIAWCEDAGVRVSTRQGNEGYQRLTWPRRRRCKEGNLAYFYDHFGYEMYDVVSQLDADHVPDENYLAHMVRPFADKSVGYVSAPSVCDANADVSWTVRGRLYDEAMFHSSQQAGHNAGLAPVCIGSHYAVRTDALREIGGLGPELAEDFTTSYLLTTAGWQGVFAIDAEAHGDGPPNFRAMVTQEFQWSRSLALTLFTLAPGMRRILPAKPRIRFGIALGYYVHIALTVTLGLASIAVAAAFSLPWVQINFFVFLAFSLSISIVLIAIRALLRRHDTLRPRTAPLLSWENIIYVFARQPYIAWGVLAAVVQRIVPRPVDFKVTPKGDDDAERLPLSLIAPFIVISAVMTGSALIGIDDPQAMGYVGLSLFSGLSYLAVAFAITLVHAHDARRNASVTATRALKLVWPPLLACTLVAPAVIYGVVVYVGVLSNFFQTWF